MIKITNFLFELAVLFIIILFGTCLWFGATTVFYEILNYQFGESDGNYKTAMYLAIPVTGLIVYKIITNIRCEM